jgi:hypothetical protein
MRRFHSIIVTWPLASEMTDSYKEMLHLCMKATYNYFIDKTDSKTVKQPCNKIAKDIASNVIKTLYPGELSDPPGISW